VAGQLDGDRERLAKDCGNGLHEYKEAEGKYH
jgi:hypothetical protein